MNESQLMLIEEKDKEIKRLEKLVVHYRDVIKGYRSANDYNVNKINKLVDVINELTE